MAVRYSRQWVDEVRERADIVQIVSRYVPLTPKGGRLWGLCPFHGEKTASFSVSPQKQLFYCFGCHKGGSALTFVMEIERVDFREAVLMVAEDLHMELPETTDSPRTAAERSEKERLYEANRQCALLYHSFIWTPQGAQALAYLHGRGVSDHTIRRFGLGAAPQGNDSATRELLAKGFTEEELVRAGISVRRDGALHDMFRNRAMFPIINARGSVLGFGGRALGEAKPKYLNTGDTPIFNKRLGVFAANLLAKERQLSRVILVEGYMDVVSLMQAGVQGVCATLGTALTLEQARLLRRYAPEIWVSYDGDEAGQHAILRALDIFEQEGIPARVLDFPDGMDPDEFVRARGAQAVEALTPMDPASYRMKQEAQRHDLSTNQGRTAYAIACARYLARVKEPVELENHIRQLMLSTGFPRDVLLAQIGRTELIEQDKRPIYRYAARPLEEKNEGADRQTLAAEDQLIRLLAEGRVEEGSLRAQDFITPLRRGIAEKLLCGMTPGAILDGMTDEDERARAARLLEEDSGVGEGQELQAVNACLRALRDRRLDEEIAEWTQRAKGLTGEEKRSVALRILELTRERHKA